jgi:hypothetical protein
LKVENKTQKNWGWSAPADFDVGDIVEAVVVAADKCTRCFAV